METGLALIAIVLHTNAPMAKTTAGKVSQFLLWFALLAYLVKTL